jgi:hypothetical protein
MAYGKNVKFEKADNLIFFSPKAKDSDGEKVAPFFTISKVVGDKIEKTDETATEITGSLVKIDVKDREFKGVMNKEAKLYLKDAAANEVYVLSLSFRMDARSLFNGLLSLQNNDPITISIYQNKKGYSAYSLKQNGARVDWKFSLEDQPQPEGVTFKGKTQYDYTKVDDFFATELNKLSNHLFNKGTESAPPEKTETKVAKEVKSDEVPF